MAGTAETSMTKQDDLSSTDEQIQNGQNQRIETTQGITAFSEDQRKYKCLCGMLHIIHGTYAVGAALGVNMILMIGEMVLEFDAEGKPPPEDKPKSNGRVRPSEARFIAEMLGVFALVGLSYALVIYGVYKQKRPYLLPFLAMGAVHVFTQVVIIVETVVLLPGAWSKSVAVELGLELLLAVLISFFTLWFMSVVGRCWIYLRDKEQALRTIRDSVVLSTPAV